MDIPQPSKNSNLQYKLVPIEYEPVVSIEAPHFNLMDQLIEKLARDFNKKIEQQIIDCIKEVGLEVSEATFKRITKVVDVEDPNFSSYHIDYGTPQALQLFTLKIVDPLLKYSENLGVAMMTITGHVRK